MATPASLLPETDPRFPSGRWTGFFVQKPIPGKHQMELRLNFADSTISGEGRDWVGEFVLTGRYSIADGKCHWKKQYVGKHAVYYQGYNEGKGIWGLWDMPAALDPAYGRGGFHIWPEGMRDPTQPTLSEEIEEPTIVEVEYTEMAPVEVGWCRV